MFCSVQKLEARSRKGGINREEYIHLLAAEYYETTNLEAQIQVTANLANFAYDPINYQFFLNNQIPYLFLNLIKSLDETLILNGITGICNCCLDKEFQLIFIENNNLQVISQLINHKNTDISVNAIITLIFLTTPQTKSSIYSIENINKIKILENSEINRIKTVARLFLKELS